MCTTNTIFGHIHMYSVHVYIYIYIYIYMTDSITPNYVLVRGVITPQHQTALTSFVIRSQGSSHIPLEIRQDSSSLNACAMPSGIRQRSPTYKHMYKLDESMYIYIYIFTYMNMYIYTYLCIYIDICICIYIYTYTYVLIYKTNWLTRRLGLRLVLN